MKKYTEIYVHPTLLADTTQNFSHHIQRQRNNKIDDPVKKFTSRQGVVLE